MVLKDYNSRKERKIRILIVSANQMYANGAVNKLVDFCFEYLNSVDDYEAKILSEKYKDISLKENLQIKNYIKYSARPGRLRTISVFLSIFLKLLINKHPDIIHLHQIGIELLPLLLFSKIFGTKLVITNHISSFKGNYRDKYFEYKVPYDIITKLFFISTRNYLKYYEKTTFIALSKELKTELQNIGLRKQNIEYIPNGIKIGNNKNTNLNYEKINIIWAGRYETQKNLTLLFHIALKLKEAKKDFTVNVFGLYENELDEYDRNLYSKISDCVFLNGYTDDLISEIQKCNLGLFTSLFEAMSLAMLEMLNCGIPVISTPVSGMIEVIEENDCGIVSMSFNPQEIANNIISLFNNKAEYMKKSQNAINSIKENYNINNNIKNHINLYKKLILN